MNDDRQKQVRRRALRLTLTYTAMVLAVLVLLTIMVVIMMGYRYNSTKGAIEQTGVAQLGSRPNGATIEIDGNRIDKRTNDKISLYGGQHEFVVWREGYETWRKTVPVNPGRLTWLDYIRLVPKDLKTKTLGTIEGAVSTQFMADGARALTVIKSGGVAHVEVINTRDKEKITREKITLSPAVDDNAVSDITIKEVGQSGRYVLVAATVSGKTQWLRVDVERTTGGVLNVSEAFGGDAAIAEAKLAGSDNGHIFVLDELGNFNRMETGGKHEKQRLITNVAQFVTYGEHTLAYVSKPSSERTVSVGVLKNIDAEPAKIATLPESAKINVALNRYYDKDYLAISHDRDTDIYEGTFPSKNTTSNDGRYRGFVPIRSFSRDEIVTNLVMSGNGRFVVAGSELGYKSFDLELMRVSDEARYGQAWPYKTQWLDDYIIWNSDNGKLVIREFDGANPHTITPIIADGNTVSFDRDNKAILSIGSQNGVPTVQRTELVLE